ncbi:MAG TPA: HNH endonuclease [Humisphaera sp.]|jgi:hypothetical protein|nr:HNH endonuclease [Humisphaera sp.]
MIGSRLRALVLRRAKGRCEYCRIHQSDVDFPVFHVEHVIPHKHGGSNKSANLCLACPECNFAKGPNVAGLINGKLFPLFHPRRQLWKQHFRWQGAMVVGTTKVGAVTVRVLNMNSTARLKLRRSLMDEQRFPPLED